METDISDNPNAISLMDGSAANICVLTYTLTHNLMIFFLSPKSPNTPLCFDQNEIIPLLLFCFYNSLWKHKENNARSQYTWKIKTLTRRIHKGYGNKRERLQRNQRRKKERKKGYRRARPFQSLSAFSQHWEQITNTLHNWKKMSHWFLLLDLMLCSAVQCSVYTQIAGG